MATFWHHQCDACGYEFDTSGPHGFYRDRAGRLADFGHPLPSSREAAEAGVAGFYGRMWCLQHDVNVEVVIREFCEPADRFAGIWMPGAHPEKRVMIACPSCGDDEPVMGDRPLGPGIRCPKCVGGRIGCEVRMVS
jgi:hypothetical protein